MPGARLPRRRRLRSHTRRVRDDQLNGPDIYRSATVTREVYTVKGTVRQGNSGGPLVNRGGGARRGVRRGRRRQRHRVRAHRQQKCRGSWPRSTTPSPVPTGPACRRHSRVDDAAADAAEERTVGSGRVDDAAADAAEEERDGRVGSSRRCRRGCGGGGRVFSARVDLVENRPT